MLSCSEEEYKLPDETQQGEDTFGMLVDGNPWQPYYPGLIPGASDRSPEIFYYNTGYNNTGLLYFEAKNYDIDQSIYFSVSNVYSTGTYQADLNLFKLITDSLNFHCDDTSRFETNYNYVCDSSYFLQNPSKSFIKITHFDTTEKIVSGRFEMELVNEEMEDTIKITEGRFDSHFVYNQ